MTTRFHYANFTQELAVAQEAHQQVRRQFQRLTHAVRQLFHVGRCEMQLPVAGPLVLRACFTDRRQVPSWSVVHRLAIDYLHPGTFCGTIDDCHCFGDFKLSTGLDYWTPSGVPEYFFEIRLEYAVCFPN